MSRGATRRAGSQSQSPAPPLPLPVIAAALGALLLWSGTSTANKFGTFEIDAVTVGLLRSALAGVIALVVARFARLPFPADLKSRGLLVYAGLSSFCIWPGILSLGLGWTSASHAVFIIAIIPVFTGLIAFALERRLPQAGWWLGTAMENP